MLGLHECYALYAQSQPSIRPVSVPTLDSSEILNGNSNGEESKLESVPIDGENAAATPTLDEVLINYSRSLTDPSTQFQLELEAERAEHFLEIAVTQPQKIGDGMGAYMAYKVCSRTNMPVFKRKELCVLRRFSDFLGLHDKLTEKYLKVGRIIPPAPEKSVIGAYSCCTAQLEKIRGYN